MISSADLQPTYDALDSCQAALDKLDKLCCEPGRSPRMRALGETVEKARIQLRQLGDNGTGAEDALASLEDAGAQVGRLQVGCCAPSRLPLYAEFLEGLTTAQLSINAEMGRAHQ